MKTLIRYFLQGLLILVPITITLYIVVAIVLNVGSLLNNLGVSVHPLIDPLLGFIAVMFIILFIGFIGSTLLFRPFLLLVEKMVERAPLIKTIYSSIKDLLSAFVGSKKRFDKPVLVTTKKGSDIQQLGFITQNDLSHLGIKDDKVAVYFPYSYAFSGMLLIVPRENVTPLEASSVDVMKFIISGGVTDID